MARKVILDVDPGISDAVAICLAMEEPDFEVIGVTATGGNVRPEQSTVNVQAVVEQLDPPRLPRLGAAIAEQLLRADNRHLYGTDGLCGAIFAVAQRHHQYSSVKLICDEVKSAPGEVTIIALGPLSNLALAIQQQPEVAELIGHLVIMGGTLSGPGNVTAAAEFNVFCDAEASQAVFRSPVTKTVVPLDLAQRVLLGFDVLEKLPDAASRKGELLQKILPGAYRAYRQLLGMEGIQVLDAVAMVAAARPEWFTMEPMHGDVEIEGTITHGATVFDRRRVPDHQPNMDVAVDMDVSAVTNYILDGICRRG